MRIPCTPTIVISLLVVFCASTPCYSDNASTPLGDPVLELPTLRCLGVYWVIRGDENQNARVEFHYRKTGGADWREGPPLFRVERRKTPYIDQGGNPRTSKVQVPDDAW